MRIKPDISHITMCVSVSDLAKISALAMDYNRLLRQLKDTERKNARMREELTKYQKICEKRKQNSGTGVSVESQNNTNKHGRNENDRELLTNDSEGSVSGGERSFIS